MKNENDALGLPGITPSGSPLQSAEDGRISAAIPKPPAHGATYAYTITAYDWEGHHSYFLIHLEAKSEEQLMLDFRTAARSVWVQYKALAEEKNGWVTKSDWTREAVEFMKRHFGYMDSPDDQAHISLSTCSDIIRKSRRGPRDLDSEWRDLVGSDLFAEADALNKKVEKDIHSFRI